MKPRERVIRVLLQILGHPHHYSRQRLADYFGWSIDSITEHIQAIKDAGVKVDYEVKKGQHFYAIDPDRQFDELRYLQPLSDADMARIGQAFNYINPKDAFYLKKKLQSLYDFQKLGLNALRRPALERLNQLERGRKLEKQVILEKYRSNSNEIKDRQIEAFLWDPELDTIQAFDPKDEKIKHFKLSRIERIHLTEDNWQFKDKHDERPTDVFRIAKGGQKSVELKIDVYAYNSLIDNYPKAKGECVSGVEPNTFNFQTKVNPDFLGLVNFIMNNAGHIQILNPPELKDKVKERIKILLKDLEK